MRKPDLDKWAWSGVVERCMIKLAKGEFASGTTGPEGCELELRFPFFFGYMLMFTRIWQLTILVLLFGASGCWEQPAVSRISFDSEKWREASPSDVKGLRIRMMDDLVSSKRLIGKSRLEVEQQLGDPESTTPNEIPDTDLLFRVGPDIHFGFDTVCLHLKMDELDLVKEVFVVVY
jgi:hypothetical protein